MNISGSGRNAQRCSPLIASFIVDSIDALNFLPVQKKQAVIMLMRVCLGLFSSPEIQGVQIFTLERFYIVGDERLEEVIVRLNIEFKGEREGQVREKHFAVIV